MNFVSTRTRFAFAVAFCASIQVAPQLSAEPTVDWYSMNNGSARTSMGADYQLRGSIGQPVIGFSDGEGYELSAGFWQVRDTQCGGHDGIFCNSFED